MNQLLQGDALEVLRTLPAESVDCCVTSPPYWGLRDYGVAGQLGLEKTFDEYLRKLVVIFDEVRRVLKPKGTAWVNMGDCYNTRKYSDSHTFDPKYAGRNRTHGYPNRGETQRGIKNKDLIGQPWRLAFALRDAGWWLRQDIIWHKPAPMPESVTDRCTKAHEYIFLLSKGPRYYFDAKSIRTPSITGDMRTPYGSQGAWEMDGRPKEQQHGGKLRKAKRPDGWASEGEKTAIAHSRSKERAQNEPLDHGSLNAPLPDRTRHDQMADGANKRSVWTIASKGYSGAHFATFPAELAETCILAGCPPEGLVLDPFGGSGTVAEVALKLGREYLLIELNPDYLKLQHKRLAQYPILTASIT